MERRKVYQPEYHYEIEQEMLKYVHDLEKGMREKGWWERESPEVSRTVLLTVVNLVHKRVQSVRDTCDYNSFKV